MNAVALHVGTRITVAGLAVCITLPQLHAQAPARWRLVAEARFGNAGDEQTELTRVTGIAVAPDGRVLIADAAANRILRFTPKGQYIDAVGRVGAGPGEFKALTGFGRAPDGTLWINDPGNNRITVLQSDGTFLRQVSVFNNDRLHVPVMVDAQRRLLTQVISDPSDPNWTMKMQRRRMDGTVIDTVAIPECAADGKPPVRTWMAQGKRVPVPLSHWGSEVLSTDGTKWCTAGSTYLVRQFRLGRGDTVTTIRRSVAPLPIAASVRDSAINAVRAMLKAQNLTDAGVNFDDVPRVQAAIIGLAIDDQKQLWVRQPKSGADRARFDVFNSSGRHMATVAGAEDIYRSFTPVIVGNALYAVVLDEDDVQTVVRFRVERLR